jgi:hypothetical protein
VGADKGRLFERGGKVRWRAGPHERGVDASHPLTLGRIHLSADQFVDIWNSSRQRIPSKREARRAGPLRVRVLTVPSGTSSRSATSVWLWPPRTLLLSGWLSGPSMPIVAVLANVPVQSRSQGW